MSLELQWLEFPSEAAAIEMLCEWMTGQIGDTDCITRPAVQVVMLLTAGPNEGFLHLRRRLLSLWDSAWRDSGFAPPASAIVDQHVALAGPEDAEAFLAAAGVWLSQH